MIVIDTSALIRFFTNDDVKKAKKVKDLIESQEQLTIPDVVFPEVEYVLFSKTYEATREKILTGFKFLTSKNNIAISKEVKLSIQIYEETSLDMADCIIAASALYKNIDLASFDTELLKVRGVKGHF